MQSRTENTRVTANTLDPTRWLSFNAWITQDDNDKGPGVTSYIKPEIREAMGTRVHGCDICQEVCPRNRTVRKAERPADPFLEVLSADFSLENLLRMNEAFNQTRVQPIMYNYLKHKKYFQRNAAIAMGNTGDEAYVSLLGEALDGDPEAIVRGYAAWRLGV